MAENKRYNWLERTFGKSTNADKVLIALGAGAISIMLISEGLDRYFAWQTERREALKSPRAGIELTVSSQSEATTNSNTYTSDSNMPYASPTSD